ncbi:MAG TPA: DUF4388 domain-containing protein [Acidimicrobiales bacterium]|jgi:hypothetical protein|nr:DUF4388 domain-containing protein [Acidimicrobiales bacterium]
MSQMQSLGNVSAASLVGSLGVFTLDDVLSLLADTTQTGELQVVGSEVDGRVWLEEGELSNAHVGSAPTIGRAVFELACVPEGWFYFTSGLASSSGQPRVPVRTILEEVRPQVKEWRELLALVPLESTIGLSPEPPSGDVQLNGDQWRMVTSIGNAGHSVKRVLDAFGDEQMVGLRILRDLHEASLITLDEGPAEEEHHDPSTPGTSSGPQPSPFVTTSSPFTRPSDIPPPPPDYYETSSYSEAPTSSFLEDYGDDQGETLAEVASGSPSRDTDG